MNRERLAAAAPEWIVSDAFPAQTQLDTLAISVEAISDALEFGRRCTSLTRLALSRRASISPR